MPVVLFFLRPENEKNTAVQKEIIEVRGNLW